MMAFVNIHLLGLLNKAVVSFLSCSQNSLSDKSLNLTWIFEYDNAAYCAFSPPIAFSQSATIGDVSSRLLLQYVLIMIV
jgi:hypothetical protein